MKKTSTGGAFCIVPRALIERISLAGLNASHLGLLTFVIDRADANGVSFWSMTKIGIQLGCSKSTVSRMLSDLHRTGFVDKKPRPRRDGANSVLEIRVIGHAEFRQGRSDARAKDTKQVSVSGQDDAKQTAQIGTPSACGPQPCPATKPSSFSTSIVSQMKRAVSETQRAVPYVQRQGNDNQENNNQIKKHSSSLPKREGTNLPNVPGWNQEQEREWMSYFGLRTDIHYRPKTLPSAVLLDAAIEHFEFHKKNQTERKARQIASWSEMLSSLTVSATANELAELASTTSRLHDDELIKFLNAYREDWKAYWRRPPVPEQVKERLSATKTPQIDGSRFSELMMRALAAKYIKQEHSCLRSHKEAA
jgi:DNA-binding MarR family transcriptional regulator